MNRAEYLQVRDVAAFLRWAEPFATEERPIDHSWTSPKWGTRHYTTLFNAYKRYEWGFSVDLPESGKCKGKYYGETASFLNARRAELRVSQQREDEAGFFKAAVGVLRWGHVYQDVTLSKLGNGARLHLTTNASRLHPATADLDHLAGLNPMSAGFSKLYSLLVDGFPIYDSRVGCALASLVRLFCHEEGRDAVPEPLKVDVPLDRASVSRDPSCEQFRFERIASGSTTRYARSNVKAAWLLGELAKHPPFSGEDDQLHALQSALFMIGYAPLDRPCSHCPTDA